MPKAAAVEPEEWALTRDRSEPFEIGALNRVVLDHAAIDLALSKRWYRRTTLGRACSKANRWLTVLGAVAGAGLAIFPLDGDDVDTLVPALFGLSALACAGVLSILVPWLLTPYRQWNRTLRAVSVAMMAVAVVRAAILYFGDLGPVSPWTLATPCVLLFLVSLVALDCAFRLRTDEKPPPVDAGSLSREETEVLLAARRRALRSLRSHRVIDDGRCRKYDRAPLVQKPSDPWRTRRRPGR